MRDLYIYKDEEERFYGHKYDYLYNTFFISSGPNWISPIKKNGVGGCYKCRGKKLKVIRTL